MRIGQTRLKAPRMHNCDSLFLKRKNFVEQLHKILASRRVDLPFIFTNARVVCAHAHDNGIQFLWCKLLRERRA